MKSMMPGGSRPDKWAGQSLRESCEMTETNHRVVLQGPITVLLKIVFLLDFDLAQSKYDFHSVLV